MAQTWNDLLFAHWPVRPEVLRPLVPSVLPLDTFGGQCWVAVTPFHMTGVRPRPVPPLPGISRFPELNVRTYVNFGGKPGVFFFSLDAANRLAVWAARATYKLPYFFAEMKVAEKDGWIRYRSSRQNGSPRGQTAQLEVEYRAASSVQLRTPGTLEHWLSERYCLYAVEGTNVYRAEIHHEQWPLQDADAKFIKNTMAKAANIDLPNQPPLLHFAKRLEVLIWPLTEVDGA